MVSIRPPGHRQFQSLCRGKARPIKTSLWLSKVIIDIGRTIGYHDRIGFAENDRCALAVWNVEVWRQAPNTM